MNEAVTKRFLLYFRLMLLVWILIANAIIHVTGLEYSWLIFLSNIMMFTLEGDVKDRFVTVELGGLVGLILTVIALLSITALTPVLGGFFGFLIPLAVVLFILIILHPYAPKVLNNVGFAYLTVACIDTTALATHLPQFFITFIVGSVLFNGVCVLLNDGCVRVTGLYSEKTGKTYDATVVLEDDGQYANFKLEFDQRKGGSR